MRPFMSSLAVLAILGTTGAADAKRRAMPVAAETGPAISCIRTTDIRETRVRSDQVIDFKVSGNKWYRNTLPHNCPSLGFEERFLYKTTNNQLCSVDVVTVLYSHGRGLNQGPSCGLGKFQPVTLARR